jgi:hypothetical protein
MGGFGAKVTLAALGALSLAGCGTSGDGGGLSSLGNMVLFAGTTEPPVAPLPTADTYCPSVGVTEGGAALQTYAAGRVGDAGALRSQVALGQLARECSLQPDGSVLVKVGVEGRALQGAVGGGGRFDVPVRIVVKDGSTVFANRVRRTSVTVPAGDTQGTFAIVEEGIVVPPSSSQGFEIEVGLGTGGPAGAGEGRRRRG